MQANRDSTYPDVPRGEAGKWLPGTSPNPGGKPKKLREIEAMLDAEHRTVENMRAVFAKLKAIALGEATCETVTKDGDVIEFRPPADGAFAKLYLERVLGPVKEVEEIDLSDAPPEVLTYLRNLQ